MILRLFFITLILSVLSSCLFNENINYSESVSNKEVNDLTYVLSIYEKKSKGLNSFEPMSGYFGHFVNDRVFFKENSSVINEAGQKILDKQIEWIKNNKADILLKSYAAGTGSRAYKLAVSERRAFAVKNYMVSSGVEAEKITVVSYGKDFSIGLRLTDRLGAENRVVITSVVE